MSQTNEDSISNVTARSQIYSRNSSGKSKRYGSFYGHYSLWGPPRIPRKHKKLEDDTLDFNNSKLLPDTDPNSLRNYVFPTVRRSWKQTMQRFLGFFLGTMIPYALFTAVNWSFACWQLDLGDPIYSYMVLTEPALNFRPAPRQGSWGTLIQYNQNDKSAIQELVDSMSEAVEEYEEESRDAEEDGDYHTHNKVCNWGDGPTPHFPCRIDTQGFGSHCYKNQKFGFDEAKPEPEPYETLADLKAAGFPLNWEEKDFSPRYIPITCEGATKVDQELMGVVEYRYPMGVSYGFPTYYFPFEDQLHYAAPGVMVDFQNITLSVVVRIVCKLWAKNVRHVREGPLAKLTGAVEFEMMIDSGIY